MLRHRRKCSESRGQRDLCALWIDLTNTLSSLLSLLSLSPSQDPLDHYPPPRRYNGLDYRETDPYSNTKVPYLPTPLPPENTYRSPPPPLPSYQPEPPTFRPPVQAPDRRSASPAPPPTYYPSTTSPNPGLYLTPDIQKSPIRHRDAVPVPGSQFQPLPHPRPVLPEPEPFDDDGRYSGESGELSNFFDEPFGQDDPDPGVLDYTGDPMPSAQPYSAKPYSSSPPSRPPPPPPSPESYYEYPPPGTCSNKNRLSPPLLSTYSNRS